MTLILSANRVNILITSYIYKTSDNLYLIYSEGACQYSSESKRIQNITCSVNDL
jgi:hypothetical protein